MRIPGKSKTRHVFCTHCGADNEVSAKAMSVFCAHCRKRLILENYVIKSFQGLKEYATCGDVVVEKSGRVAAAILAGNLTVKGVVQGDVKVRGCVEVASTGKLSGRIETPALRVQQGAVIDGFCRIEPTRQSEPAAAATPDASAATPTPPPAGAGDKPQQRVKAIVTTRRRNRSASEKR